MDQVEISKQVSDIVVYVLCLEPDEFDENSKLKSAYGADSLDIIEIVREIEVKFNVRIHDFDVEKFSTSKDITNCIFNKLNPQKTKI